MSNIILHPTVFSRGGLTRKVLDRFSFDHGLAVTANGRSIKLVPHKRKVGDRSWAFEKTSNEELASPSKR